MFRAYARSAFLECVRERQHVARGEVRVDCNNGVEIRVLLWASNWIGLVDARNRNHPKSVRCAQLVDRALEITEPLAQIGAERKVDARHRSMRTPTCCNIARTGGCTFLTSTTTLCTR